MCRCRATRRRSARSRITSSLDAPLTGDAAADAGASARRDSRRPRLSASIDGAGHAGQLDVHGHQRIARRARVGEYLSIEGDVVAARVASPRRRARRSCCCATASACTKSTDGAARDRRRHGASRVSHRGLHCRRAGRSAGAVDAVQSDLRRPRDASARRSARADAPPSRIPARSAEASRGVGPRRQRARIDGAAARRAGAGRSPAMPPLDVALRAVAGHARAGSSRRCRFPVAGGLAAFDRVQFRVSAPSADARVGAAARAGRATASGGEATFYVGRAAAHRSTCASPTSGRSASTSSAQPPLDRVDSLLLVVDTLNTLPGATGRRISTHLRTRDMPSGSVVASSDRRRRSSHC